MHTINLERPKVVSKLNILAKVQSTFSVSIDLEWKISIKKKKRKQNPEPTNKKINSWKQKSVVNPK